MIDIWEPVFEIIRTLFCEMSLPLEAHKEFGASIIAIIGHLKDHLNITKEQSELLVVSAGQLQQVTGISLHDY